GETPNQYFMSSFQDSRRLHPDRFSTSDEEIRRMQDELRGIKTPDQNTSDQNAQPTTPPETGGQNQTGQTPANETPAAPGLAERAALDSTALNPALGSQPLGAGTST